VFIAHPTESDQSLRRSTVEFDRLPVHLVERPTGSDELVVFFHGMGLDASDFHDAMTGTELHTVALTMSGFDPADRDLPPVPVESHLEVLSRLVAELRDRYPDKRMILAGFSLGADMVLRLAERWHADPTRAPKLYGALLLDPNVNHATMTISRIFAAADPTHPLCTMRDVVLMPDDVFAFGQVCGYLAKLSTKSFPQVHRIARDFVDYWEPAGRYGLLGARLRTLADLVDRLHVVFSGPYEEHLAAVRAELARRAIDNASYDHTALDHFELIAAPLLARQLDAFRIGNR